ncbi:MAG TPA: CsgG/HfaB family protein [Synergistales bacterium]|nr:CsgG/HfaB family protein [Synergistales bacterium]HRV71996.1 CsgG/HfaB family protein [Thermovirgaceae bacterium]
MKKMAVMIVAGLVVFAFAGTALAEMTIAVTDFRSLGCQFYLGGAVAEQVRNHLSEEDGWIVVEKGQIAAVAAEQRLNLSGLVDDDTAVKVGNYVGARYVIVGSVNGMGDTYTLSARLVDVETGIGLIGFETSTGEGEEGVLDASRVLAEQIVIELGGSTE